MQTEIREGFIRQRRNLIIVSLLLIFAEISGLEIKKINVFGNELYLENPPTINIALWVAYIYWVIRYYQYFNDIEQKGFKSTFYSKLHKYAKAIAIQNLSNSEIVKKYFSEPAKENQLGVYPKEYKIIKHSLTKIEGSVQYVIGRNSSSGTIKEQKIDIEQKQLIIPIFLSVMYLIFHTRLFTEYLLPFLIAILPITYVTYKTIHNYYTCV